MADCRKQDENRPIPIVPTKASTGITGFDEITDRGLPRDRTTLLEGGPGSDKAILELQFLVHGAQDCKEPGISGASAASYREPK